MGLLDALKNTVRQVKQVVHQTEQVAASTVAKVEHFAGDRFEDAKKAAGPLINHAAQNAMNAAVAATNVTRSIAAHGIDTVQAASNHAIDSAQRRVTGAVDSAQHWANDVINSGQHLAGGVVDRAEKFTNREIDSAQRLTNGVVDSAQRFTNSVVDHAQAATLARLDRLPGPFGLVDRMASSAIDFGQQLGGRAVDGAQGLAQQTVNGAQAVSTGAVNSAQSAANGAVDLAQAAGTTVVDGSQTLASKAVDAGQSLGTGAVDVSQTVVAANARAAERVAALGVNGAATLVRPFALTGLSVAHEVLKECSDDRFDGNLIGANGQAYPRGTKLSDVPGVLPASGAAPSETILYVNGISTTEQAQASDLQKIADATGAKVIGLHNSTEGFLADGAQVFTDKFSGRNSAVSSLASTIYDELKAGRPVHLLAHSQGGLVTSRALSVAKDRLIHQDGMSRDAAEKLLGNVTCETFAAATRNYPDGPKYIHTINRLDVVPGLLGLGPGLLGTGFDSHPGRGAVTRYFTGDLGGHGLLDEYLPQRQAP